MQYVVLKNFKRQKIGCHLSQLFSVSGGEGQGGGGGGVDKKTHHHHWQKKKTHMVIKITLDSTANSFMFVKY